MIVAFGKWWVKWLVLADFFVSCLTLGLSFDMSWLRERRNSSTEKEISIGQLQVRSLVLRQNALESDRCFFLKRVSLGQSNGFPSSSHVICCFPVDGMGETAGESPQKKPWLSTGRGVLLFIVPSNLWIISRKCPFMVKIEGPGAGKNQLVYQVYHLSISIIIEIYLFLKG